MPTRKTHAFLKRLPDKHNGSFKTVLPCERPRDGGAALDCEDIANRATSYHAMQIRGKVSVHNDCTGSHGRALNTVVHGKARELCRQGGRGQRRSHRGNHRMTANGNTRSSNSNISNGGFNPNGNGHGGNSAGYAQVARGRGRGNQASGRGRQRSQDNGQKHKRHCMHCHNSTEHGWKTAGFVSRMRWKVTRNGQIPCRSLLRMDGSRRSRKTTESWRTSNLLAEITRRRSTCCDAA